MEQDTQELIETIQDMKEHGVFKNYIEYIVFPFYKNLIEGTRINFTFPLTVLVGKMDLERALLCMLCLGPRGEKPVGIFGFQLR